MGEPSDAAENKSPDFAAADRGLSLIAFRRSITDAAIVVRLTVGSQDTIGFVTPETLVREKKIPG
jgi:hypothetical protein